MKFKILALLLGAFVFFSELATAQVVVGGAGVCYVNANPNTVPSISAGTLQTCRIAINTTALPSEVWWYNDANVSGSKFQLANLSGDGVVTALSVAGGNLSATRSLGLPTLTVPTLSIAPVQSVAAGTGAVTVTNVAGVVTVNSTDPDESLVNEGLLGVTAGAATTSVLQGYNLAGTAVGAGVTLTAGAGLAIAETTSTNGGTITLSTVPTVTAVYYASDAAATTGGVAINTQYALDTPNIYGLPKGIVKVRQ
jgi:hypothetical protein